MSYEIIKHRLGRMTFIYTVVDGTMQFTFVPASKEKNVSEDKLILKDRKYNAPDSAVQAHVFGDRVNRQYSAGQTMRNSQSSFALKFLEQKTFRKGDRTEIVSFLVREDGQRAEHHLIHCSGEKFAEVYTVYENGSDKAVTLEMLSSFSVGSLTPFRMDNGAHLLDVYRMRSQWSSEARLEKTDAAGFVLEPSWMNYGARGERFGSIGSMPAKKFMPFIGLTDKKERVTWAAALGCASSWQLEFYMAQDSVCLSGGIADFEFGHWRKTLSPGERLETPHAYLTCVCGGIDKASQYLTGSQIRNLKEEERSLPVLYNEYCRDWGECTKENLYPAIDCAASLGMKYFVIDAGWADRDFDKNGRRWKPKEDYYPDGLGAVTDHIRSKGMKAGLWFEPESFMFEEDCNDLPVLKRYGEPIRNLERVFLDMTDKNNLRSLREGVIGTLAKYRFDYVKIDYNENIGVGCDGAESLGEGLRRQVNASLDFYREMRRALPELTVEMCSSGGMRCEPSVIEIADMMSFSDLHESEDEPIVACDMQRVLHPVKSQIWATLHETDTPDKLVYTLACGFYGRMCLSGFIDKLSEQALGIVRHALQVYEAAVPIIRDGFSYFVGSTPPQRHPEGYKGIVRENKDTVMAVVHIFDDENTVVRIRHKCFRSKEIVETFLPEGAKTRLDGDLLEVLGLRKNTAFVVLAKNKYVKGGM